MESRADVPDPAALGETRFRTLTEALPALVFVTDTSGRNVFTNEWVVHYSSVSREAMLGDGWLQLLHPEDRDRAREGWREAISTGKTYEGEFRFRHRNGQYHRHACRAEPRRNENGEVIEWIGVCIDVEDQRRGTEDLRALLDMLPVGVFIAHDPQCHRISGNRAAADLLRLPMNGNLSKSAPSEQVPMNFRILKNGREIPTDDLPVQRAARGETVRSEEVDHEFEDGTVVQTLISAVPLYDSAGRPRGAVAAILDVTGLKSAEAADRRKAEFLAELGHELRNPLAPLSMALELFERGDADPELRQSLLATMRRQLGYLVSLVDDLLDVARVNRGEVNLQRAPLDLRDVVESALEIAQPQISARRHELIVQRADVPVPIDGDPKRLTQVVVNLLGNAAKYTQPGGTIRVSTGLDGDGAVLRVQDTGVGIPRDQLQAIFEMFSRVRAERTHEGDRGLGIGLALARRLIALHGGQIEAHSEGIGRGSEFVIHLPVAKSAGTSDILTPSRPKPAKPLRRVLVVDDNADAADVLRLLLELEGHEARAVHAAQAALEAVQSFRPEIVLLDIGLPDMDGYEVAKRIRASHGQRILLVAVSGWGQAEDRRRSEEAGFDEHLTKPITSAQLERVLEAYEP